MDFFVPKFKDVKEFEEFIYRGINISRKKELSIQDLILYITIISGMHKNQERRSLVIMSMFDQDQDGFLNKQDLAKSFLLVSKLTENSTNPLMGDKVEEFVEKAFKYDKKNHGMLQHEELLAILSEDPKFFDHNFLKETIFDKLVETFDSKVKETQKSSNETKNSTPLQPQVMERRSSLSTVSQALKKGLSIFEKKDSLELSPLKNRSQSNGSISLTVHKSPKQSPKESPRLKNDMPPPESPRGIKILFQDRKSLDKNSLSQTPLESPRNNESPKSGSLSNDSNKFFKIPKLFDKTVPSNKDSLSGTPEEESILVSPRNLTKTISDALFKRKSFTLNTPIGDEKFTLKKNESLADMKKMSMVKSPRIFGIDLGKVVKRDNQEVPVVFLKLVDYMIEKNAHEYEGIFRISGNQEQVENMINEFENGKDVDLSKYKDLNCHAAVLKQYLRSLPNPLLTYELYPEFMKLLTIESEEERVKEIKRLVELLPECNRLSFGKLLQLLDKIQGNCKVNMMNPTNLAVVFGVNCLKKREDIDPFSMITENAKVTKIFEELIVMFEKYKEMFKFDIHIKKPEVLSGNEILEKFLKEEQIDYVEVNDIEKPEPDFEIKKQTI